MTRLYIQSRSTSDPSTARHFGGHFLENISLTLNFMARVIQYNMLSEDNNIDMTRKPPPVPLQQPFGPGSHPNRTRFRVRVGPNLK